jgi:hypothetical protein
MKTGSDNARAVVVNVLISTLSIAALVLCCIGCRPHEASRLTGEPELSASESESIRAAVEAVLRAQEQSWNRGDIDAFVDHYWKSDELTFSSGGKTTRGWTETLNRYWRSRYWVAGPHSRSGNGTSRAKASRCRAIFHSCCARSTAAG